MGASDSINDNRNNSIILFDGVCNLCNAAVNFVLDRDPEQHFLFASLQSEKALELLRERSFDHQSLKTIIVLTEDGQLLDRSDAALYVAGKLSGGWKFLNIFKIVPRFLRDGLYNIIATYRYTLFGKKDQCRLPSAELRQRFLDAY